MLFTASASGGSAIQIAPLRIEFSQHAPATTISIKNRGNTPTLMQAQIFRWTQVDGRDVLEPSRDVLVSPPIFTVGPGGEQIVRTLGRIKPQDKTEITYRLLLKEIASQVDTEATQQGIQVLLGFSLPVFINPQTKPASRLIWQAAIKTPGKLVIKLRNDGDAHIQVNSLQIELADGNMISQQQMAYVLAKSERDWTLEIGPAYLPGAPLGIVAKTDNGVLREKVLLGQP